MLLVAFGQDLIVTSDSTVVVVLDHCCWLPLNVLVGYMCVCCLFAIFKIVEVLCCLFSCW